MRRILILLAFGTLLGCSEAVYKYGYENGDILLSNRLNNYFDLNRQQEKLLSKEYKSFKRWHRKNHLPKYRNLLSKISEKLYDQKFTSSFYQEIRRDLDKIRVELWGQVIPAMSKFMVTIEPEQAKQYIKNMKDQTAEFRNYESISRVKRYTERHGKTVEFIERISGSLNNQQEKLILSGMNDFDDPKMLWLRFREKRNIELKALLLKNSTTVEYTRFFQEWYAGTPKASASFKSFQGKSELIFSGYQSIFVPLIASFSNTQRENAKKNLQSWSKIIKNLQGG